VAATDGPSAPRPGRPALELPGVTYLPHAQDPAGVPESLAVFFARHPMR
jgi:hypothetical protein